MSTTAEFSGEVAHGYHTYLLVVFLTEQCHSSGFLSFFDIHDLCVTGSAAWISLFTRASICNFFRCHCLKMSKVKTKSVRCYQRTFLFYMRAKNCFQCFLKKMCCAVVFLSIFSSLLIYFQGYCLLPVEIMPDSIYPT